MKKSIRLVTFEEMNEEKVQDINYWLSKSVTERINGFGKLMEIMCSLQNISPSISKKLKLDD